ncbi:nitroreductase family protein [Moorena sp. SIOASIH]|uniref:nitroreductase family protein n=1 Tax=Moorena sp. SIOASIH TaxID=2607817 RepID=UPI00344C7B32
MRCPFCHPTTTLDQSFKPDPIEPALIEQLINLTVAAPSASNLQPWRIVLVQNPEKKQHWRKPVLIQMTLVNLILGFTPVKKLSRFAPITFVFTAESTAGKKHQKC